MENGDEMTFQPPQNDYEIGERMLQVLDERGWCQGSLESPTKQICLIGALNIALFGTAVHNKATGLTSLWRRHKDRLKQTINAQTRQYNNIGVGHWNDAASTTEKDVRLIIKKTFFEGKD